MTEIHYWTLEEIERHIEVAFCKECKTPIWCEYCTLAHLMNDLKHIENKMSNINQIIKYQSLYIAVKRIISHCKEERESTGCAGCVFLRLCETIADGEIVSLSTIAENMMLIDVVERLAAVRGGRHSNLEYFNSYNIDFIILSILFGGVLLLYSSMLSHIDYEEKNKMRFK